MRLRNVGAALIEAGAIVGLVAVAGMLILFAS